MPTSPIDRLRKQLETERRATLSFCRALDHIGFDPSKLDWVALRALHERDADCAELLYGVERRHISPPNVQKYRSQADALHQAAQALRLQVRSALPGPFQKRLDDALPVAASTITNDDIYAEIRAAP